MVSITFDAKAKALYIHIIEDVKPVETIPMGQGNYMDISESGKTVGLEFIFPSSTPQEVFNAIIRTDEKIKQLVH